MKLLLVPDRKKKYMPLPSSLRKTVISAFLASLALSLTPVVAHAAPPADKDNSSSPPVTPAPPTLPPGKQRYIITYEKHVDAEEKSRSLKQKGHDVKHTLSNSMKASVVVASSKEIESLRNSEDVESVELDTPVSINATTSVWGLDRVDQRTKTLDGQYNITDTGAGVNVYVVDTGLYMSHTEFSGRVPASWNGINDGNGVNDCSGHGTHVAGTVAGTTYGVAKKANIIPVRALECDGSGWSSTVMAGIDWAIGHHAAGQPAVMNLSIGGFTNASFDTTIQSAINDGISVIAAAGNSGKDACLASPAKVPSAITVAATDNLDAQASWSNYGSCVDIHAPGVSIRSAYNNAPTGYNTISGTSMATPHVAGAAAILLARNPSLTPAQVHQTMINNATTGAVSAIKGSTPNRMLFIPANIPTDVPVTVTGNTLEAIDTAGSLWSYSAPGNGTLGSRFLQGTGWNNAKQILKVDWNSDGILDIVARWSSGVVTMYAGVGNNGYRAPINIGLGGWQDIDINAVKLRNTDKYPGLVARDIPTGNLYYYPNTTGGEMTAMRTQIGFGGWTSMAEISALDLDVDGKMDLLVRNPAGELKLYRTDGAGNIINEQSRTVDWGWQVMDHISVEHNFAGAGTVGIIARDTSGYLHYYPISGGNVQSRTTIGYGGWSGYNIATGTP